MSLSLITNQMGKIVYENGFSIHLLKTDNNFTQIINITIYTVTFFRRSKLGKIKRQIIFFLEQINDNRQIDDCCSTNRDK